MLSIPGRPGRSAGWCPESARSCHPDSAERRAGPVRGLLKLRDLRSADFAFFDVWLVNNAWVSPLGWFRELEACSFSSVGVLLLLCRGSLCRTFVCGSTGVSKLARCVPSIPAKPAVYDLSYSLAHILEEGSLALNPFPSPNTLAPRP